MSVTVVDASVFNKLFLDEPDRPRVMEFFEHATIEGLPVGAPELLKLEACQCALHFGYEFSVPLKILDAYEAGGFQWISLDTPHWELAEKMSKDGNPKSGYPGLIDSLYHASALLADGTFLTADRRHASKAQKFGSVTLLEDWKP